MIENVIAYYLFEHFPLTIGLICHFLSDFHLQSPQLATQKNKHFKALCLHMFWVALPMIFVGFLYNQDFVGFFFKIWLVHFAIDCTKYFLTKNGYIKPSWENIVFLIDQIVHVGAIFLIYSHYSHLAATLDVTKTDHPPFPILNIILLLVLITKPVNIVFKLFFSKYQPDEEEVEGQKTKAGAGALIGQLERLIMVIFLLMGQYAAIGLVFTAKSIARYDRISKDQGFAEYYLIGSLFSMISVLVLYALIVLY